MYCKPIGQTLLSAVRYDPTVPGCLTGLPMHQRRDGYWILEFPRGNKYLAHRVVWALHHGDPGGVTIDHENTDQTNNRIENLRLATTTQQNRNTGMRRSNTSGVKGLHWCASESRWVGQIHANGKHNRKKSRHREVVERWLIEKRRELHGEFTNHGEVLT